MKNGKKSIILNGNRCLTIKTKKEMKKNLFVVAAAALMALVSCNKEELGNKSNGVVFVAELEQDASTKTALGEKGEKGRKALWVEGDKISINGTEFSAVSGGEVAEFTTTAEFTEADVYRAVYPASSYYSNTHVLIPETQDGTFANASIAVAESNTNTLVFNNFSSILKFQVPTACETVSFESNVSLNGRVKVDYADGNFTADYAGITSGANRQTITVKAEGGFVPDKDYYVAVRPYTHKFTVKIDGNIAKDSKKTVYLERSKVYNFGILFTKQSRNLAFDQTSVSYTLGTSFTAPNLTGVKEGIVTYTSSNTKVATVDATSGAVTIVGAGETTIIASVAATDTYWEDEATYKLIVNKQSRDLTYGTNELTHILGNAFTAPELSGIKDGVTYNSLNTAVATIDATGKVTIVGAEGTTTITASAPETENYLADEATYTLIVEKALTDWNLRGSFGTINMTKSDVYTDLYVAKNVALGSGKTFRFINKDKSKTIGAYGNSTQTVDVKGEINNWYDSDATNGYSANITVSTNDDYDIYFSPRDNNFLIIKTGVEYGFDSQWEIVGWINGKDSWSGSSGYVLKSNYVNPALPLKITIDLTSGDYFKILKNKNWTAGSNGGWIGAPGNDGSTKDYTIDVNKTTTVNTYHSYDNHKAQFHMKNKGTYTIEVTVSDSPYTSATVKFTRTK